MREMGNKKWQEIWDRPDFVSKVEVKLADLGLSKTIDNETNTTETIVGTRNFIAPELILNRDYDFKADVWSLGSLIFELVVGQPIMGFYEPDS